MWLVAAQRYSILLGTLTEQGTRNYSIFRLAGQAIVLWLVDINEAWESKCEGTIFFALRIFSNVNTNPKQPSLTTIYLPDNLGPIWDTSFGIISIYEFF